MLQSIVLACASSWPIEPALQIHRALLTRSQGPIARASRAQAAFVPAFLRDERLQAYVRAGQLELVLWDHLGQCKGPKHMRCWQPLVYSHAVLEAWGGGARLLISDIDEYFVLPRVNTSLATSLEFCTGVDKAMARPAWEPVEELQHGASVHGYELRDRPSLCAGQGAAL